MSSESTPGQEGQEGFTIAFYSLGSARCVFNKLIVFLLNVILFCFSQLIAEFGNIICADSTHSTCQGENKVNIFPSTFDTRPCHRKGGSTCIHTHRLWITLRKQSLNSPGILSLPDQHFLNFLLTHFLLWLGHTANFNPNTLMINCLDKEALDINKAFSDQTVSILYCYWHLWQAWEKNISIRYFALFSDISA